MHQLPQRGPVMNRPTKASVLCVAAALVYLAAFGNMVEGGPALTEAVAGFDLQSNGFAEEFCARQSDLVNSPNSTAVPSEECSFETALEEFTGPETIAD